MPITATTVDAQKLTMDLYVCVLKEDIPKISANGFLRPFQVTGCQNNHIGLRESKADAFERGKKIFQHIADLENEVTFLRITFTAAGLAYFTNKIAGPNENFASQFHKKVYFRDCETDWKTWHFVGDLPLSCTDDISGTSLVSSQWID